MLVYGYDLAPVGSAVGISLSRVFRPRWWMNTGYWCRPPIRFDPPYRDGWSDTMSSLEEGTCPALALAGQETVFEVDRWSIRSRRCSSFCRHVVRLDAGFKWGPAVS